MTWPSTWGSTQSAIIMHVEGCRGVGGEGEVLTLTKSTVTHYDPEMIRDPDWFCAFQPSADRLTPDTMHNTGKYHTHAHTATPWGLEREGGRRGQWWRWSRQRLVPFHVKSRCWCTTRDAGVYFTRRPLVRRQIQYTTGGETSARGGKWCGVC